MAAAVVFSDDGAGTEVAVEVGQLGPEVAAE